MERPNFDLIDWNNFDDFLAQQAKNAEDYIRAAQTESTIKKTQFWLRKVQETANGLGITEEFRDMDKATMTQVLCSHLMEMRRQDGENYEISSVSNFFSLVGKYMRENNLGNIEEDEEFKLLREVKNAKIKNLKKDGKGNRPNRAESITFEEEERLWDAGELGAGSPISLTRTMWWFSSLLFGLRGRDESRKMRWGDIVLKLDENGDEFLEFVERDTKTRKGDQSAGSRAFAPKIFKNEENPDRCPVMFYKEYARRRPKEANSDDAPFYLAVNHKRKENSEVWYMNAPLGKNMLGNLLKMGCEKAGVTGKKTNHSVRKTGTKRTLDAGCPPAYVAQLMGHKDVRSLQNYADADINVQRAIAASALSGTAFGESTSKRSAPNTPARAAAAAATAATAGTAGTAATAATAANYSITYNISHCANVNIQK